MSEPNPNEPRLRFGGSEAEVRATEALHATGAIKPWPSTAKPTANDYERMEALRDAVETLLAAHAQGLLTDDDRARIARIVHSIGERIAPQSESEPFRCPSVLYHGPGHQSRSRCDRTDEHGLEDEHHITDVLADWTGAEHFFGGSLYG